MPVKPSKGRWKGPTVQEIAELAGVGSASVDRVLNNRPGVKESTRKRVLGALKKLNHQQGDSEQALDIRLYCDSGEAFNAMMESSAVQVNRSVAGVEVTGHYVLTGKMEPIPFARKLETEGAEADGVIVNAREHPAINRAVRKLVGLGVPVVCLHNDLPSSRRLAYLGNDQYAAGSVAAQLIGQILPEERNSILLMMSVPFRSQQEREMGFRRVLRSGFSHLKIEERVISDDSHATTRDQLLAYFETNGCPAAIYNLAGANRGVAEALTASGMADETVFVGHELTRHSRALLEDGIMDYVISHDFAGEMTAAAEWIRAHVNGSGTSEPQPSQIFIHTRYN